MKKSLYVIVLSICMWMGFVGAQSISLIPEGDGNFGNNCLVPVDVYVDTAGQEISAMDLIMETSLDFKKFEAGDLFPYFFPPAIKENGLIHIVGFTVDPSRRVNGSGKVGTLYFNQKNGAIDGIIRLYFLEEGDTTDTNLSIAGGIDVLKEVGSAFVTFSEELDYCENFNYEEKGAEISDDIPEFEDNDVFFLGSDDESWNESIEETLKEIEEKEEIKVIKPTSIKTIICMVFLFALLLILLLLLVKNILSIEKESSKGKSKHKKK